MSGTVYVDGAGSGRETIYGAWSVIVTRPGTGDAVLDIVHAETGALLGASNQAAELTAAIMGLRWMLANGASCEMVSDSAYVVNGLNERWYERWERNGWRASKGGDVANRELWETLIGLWRALGGPTRRIKARHVRGHGRGNDAPVDVVGNHVADRAADGAAALAMEIDAEAGVTGEGAV